MTYLQRKKLAFMSIVNSVKGFVRKVSGIPPLTLPNCVDEESMIDYTIEGNSIQDGTPSPDNPIEIESVGDLTENLFDNERKWSGKGADAIPSYGNDKATYIDGGGYHLVPYDSIMFSFTNLTVGEKYTISWNLTTTHSGQNTCPIAINGSIYDYKYYYNKGTTRFSQTFTATATTKIAFGFINQAQTVKGTADITNIMLVKGSTAKAYEPYGYKIPIVCSGKNLFNPLSTMDIFSSVYSKATATYSSGITTITSNGVKMCCYCYKISVARGKKYILSVGNIANTESTVRAKILIGVDNHPDKSEYGILYANKTVVFTPTGDYVYLKSWVSNSTNNATTTIENLQLERGSSNTSYEEYKEPTTTNIYLDEPLRKIGNYGDYIDFEKGKVIRNIAKYTLTGKENWIAYGNGYTYYADILYAKKYNSLLNSHFQIDTNAQNVRPSTRFSVSATWRLYLIDDSDNSLFKGTVDGLKEWLSANKPYMIYALYTPTEKSVDLSKLPTVQGTTIYTVETAVKPNMIVTYYATAKE
jgi:hypothetical protein